MLGQALIVISMTATMLLADEKPLDKDDVDTSSGSGSSAFGDLFKSLKNLPPSMFKVLTVTAITWVRPQVHLVIHTVLTKDRP